MLQNDDVKTIDDLIKFIKINMCNCEYNTLNIGDGIGIIFDNLNLPFNSYYVEYIDEPTDENIYRWELDYSCVEDDIYNEFFISEKLFDNIHDLKCDLITFLENYK